MIPKPSGPMSNIVFRKISVYSTIFYYYTRRFLVQHPWLRKKWAFDATAAAAFERLISELPADKIFVHASLSPLKRFTSNPDTYAYLHEQFKTHFVSVVSQGFTPVVRKTKVFDVDNEPPAYGAFAKFFLNDCQFRNMDPCYSVMAMGETGFSPGDLSFSPNGIFRQMVDQDYLCVNIGLDHITCSLLHLLEYDHQVPYLQFIRESYTVRAKGAEQMLSVLIHKNRSAYAVKGYVWWNRRRLEVDLLRKGIVSSHSVGGVRVCYFSMRELYGFLSKKLQQNPFYLITW